MIFWEPGLAPDHIKWSQVTCLKVGRTLVSAGRERNVVLVSMMESMLRAWIFSSFRDPRHRNQRKKNADGTASNQSPRKQGLARPMG